MSELHRVTPSRNPYHADGQPPTLRRSVFAFMDILGYREMIRRLDDAGRSQETLERLHKALDDGRAWLEDRYLPPELHEFMKRDLYALKAFTDNIVVGWPVREDAEAELGNALTSTAWFQLQMVLGGFFIRGALSIGSAYVDEIAVFGEALWEAYDGESRVARDPRIVLTKSAIEAVQMHLTYYGDPRRAPHSHAILKDADGQWFVNYLDGTILVAEDEVGPDYDSLKLHKQIVEERLQEHRSNPAIWSKYAWVAGYHNYFCTTHPQHFSDDHAIDVDLFRAAMSAIVEP
jgi:hypothetical protein